MPEQKYPPEFEAQVRKAMDVPEPNTDAMDALRAQFIARGTAALESDRQPDSTSNPFRPEKESKMKRTTIFSSPRLAWVLTLLILASLLALAFSSPKVVNALRRLFGYIPGVGMVEQSAPLRILEKSFSIENENISLTVEQVVASADKTIVVYHYFAPAFDPSAYQAPMDGNPGNPALILPDGSKVEIRFGRRMSADGLPTDKGDPIRYSAEFPPMENAVTEVTLELPYLPALPQGIGPRDWQIPLKLIPAPDGFVIPVFEVEGNGAGGGSQIELAPPSKSSSSDANALHGIRTSLDLFIPLDDGYLLIGSMQWSEKDYPANVVKPLDYVIVMDATDAEIPFEPVLGPVPEKPQDEAYRSYWAIKVLTKSFAAPLKVRIDSASVNIHTPFVFQFDPGLNPALGQSWDLNRDVQIGDIQVRVQKATLTSYPGSSDLVFQFAIQAPPNVAGDIYIGMPASQCRGGGGSTPTNPYETIQVDAQLCRTELPPGPMEVRVTGAVLWGPWQAEWTPPATTSTAPPTLTAALPTHAEACLTGESWRQALSKNVPIPSNLTGKLVLANPSGEINMANLVSGERKLIGNGDAPSLSPDISRVAMTGPIIDSQPPNGLYVTDLVSGNTTLLPGTAAGDSAPLWSPDGTMVAFTRGPAGEIGAPGAYNIMVMNTDGSNLRQITFGSEWNQATAWMPDSAHVVYIARKEMRSGSARMVDVRTGEISPLFEINYGYGSVVISPDGKRAAYEDWLPGDIYALYVSDINGANRKLLAQGSKVTVVVPAWSPDGQWIIASVYEGNSDSRLALINVSSCQIIPLPDLSGYVGSWLP